MKQFLPNSPLFSFLLLLAGTQNVYAGEFHVDNSGIGYTALEMRLRIEEVVNTETFRSYLEKKGASNCRPTHPMLIVTFSSGLKAVFKENTPKNYHYAEVAAYRISKALGIFLVPPTVYRTINGIEGSLQLYIDAPDLKKMTFKKEVFKTLDPTVKSDSKILTYILGRLDANGTNQLALADQGTYALFLIDNSTIRHKAYLQYGGPAFICKGENHEEPTHSGSCFPYEHFQTIAGSASESLFKRYMGEKRVEKYKNRKNISFVLWDHGIYIKSNIYASGRFTKEIYQPTFDALKQLSYEDLFGAWREYYELFPKNAEALIRLTLDRRDQVISYFEKSGVILPI